MRHPESPEIAAIKVRYYRAKAKLREIQKNDPYGPQSNRANGHFCKMMDELRQRRLVELKEDRAAAKLKAETNG